MNRKRIIVVLILLLAAILLINATGCAPSLKNARTGKPATSAMEYVLEKQRRQERFGKHTQTLVFQNILGEYGGCLIQDGTKVDGHSISVSIAGVRDKIQCVLVSYDNVIIADCYGKGLLVGHILELIHPIHLPADNKEIQVCFISDEENKAGKMQDTVLDVIKGMYEKNAEDRDRLIKRIEKAKSKLPEKNAKFRILIVDRTDTELRFIPDYDLPIEMERSDDGKI